MKKAVGAQSLTVAESGGIPGRRRQASVGRYPCIDFTKQAELQEAGCGVRPESARGHVWKTIGVAVCGHASMRISPGAGRPYRA